MKMIDIGVNLANSAFDQDREAALHRAMDAGVESCILTGTCTDTSETVAKLCANYEEQFPGMLHCTAGVHPHDAKTFTSNTISVLRDLAALPQVKAIGETGLDFNRNYSEPADQEKAFAAQLELAAEVKLPVFMHERDARKRQLEIIREYRDHLVDGVIHCFTGDRKTLFNYLDLDLHIGITGWICDERRGLELQRLVHNIPLERLMLETDAPYLLPRTIKPKPKSRRNEPAYLPWILKAVAENYPEHSAIIAEQTRLTSMRFFRIQQDRFPFIFTNLPRRK